MQGHRSGRAVFGALLLVFFSACGKQSSLDNANGLGGFDTTGDSGSGSAGGLWDAFTAAPAGTSKNGGGSATTGNGSQEASSNGDPSSGSPLFQVSGDINAADGSLNPNAFPLAALLKALPRGTGNSKLPMVLPDVVAHGTHVLGEEGLTFPRRSVTVAAPKEWKFALGLSLSRKLKAGEVCILSGSAEGATTSEVQVRTKDNNEVWSQWDALARPYHACAVCLSVDEATAPPRFSTVCLDIQ